MTKKEKGTPASGRPRSYNTQLGVAPPPSAPRSGRYSSRGEDVGEGFRVDDVGRTTIVATKEALDTMRPIVVVEMLRRRAPLAARDALLVSLLDGARTASDLVTAAGIPDADVRKILDRLVRLGIVANWG